jgi:hypothetical protein
VYAISYGSSSFLKATLQLIGREGFGKLGNRKIAANRLDIFVSNVLDEKYRNE